MVVVRFAGRKIEVAPGRLVVRNDHHFLLVLLRVQADSRDHVGPQTVKRSPNISLEKAHYAQSAR